MPNPHITRLKTQPGCLSAQRTWCACLVVMVIGAVTLLLPVLALPTWGVAMGATLGVVVLPIALLLPPVIGAITAANTASDVKTIEYELLMLTPLRNRSLAWGYFYVGLWRVRTLITASAGAVIIVASLIGAGLWLYPEWNDDPVLLVQLSVGMAALSLQLIGLCLLAIGLGVALGVWTRETLGLSVMMPIILIVTVALFQYGTCWATTRFDDVNALFVLTMLAATFAPYILMLLSLWLANAGMRRSRT